MKKFMLCGIILISVFLAGCETEKPIGGETDEHGCMLMAGYTWCESKQKCLRTWEEECPVAPPEESEKITIEEAIEIAQNSDCIEKGSLTDDYIYNEYTKTWWIDLDMKEEFKKDYCNPACVVMEKTKTASINWRCTGLIPA